MANRGEKGRARLENLARQHAPKTIALLESYPEGSERRKAFELVTAAVTETYAYAMGEHTEQTRRILSLLDFDALDRYLKADRR